MKKIEIIQSIGGFFIVVGALSVFGWIWFELDFFRKLFLTSSFIILIVYVIDTKS